MPVMSENGPAEGADVQMEEGERRREANDCELFQQMSQSNVSGAERVGVAATASSSASSSNSSLAVAAELGAKKPRRCRLGLKRLKPGAKACLT